MELELDQFGRFKFPGFGDQALAVIILVLAAGISSHIMFGYGTKRAKESFIGMILLLMVGVQIFHLIPAATTVPANRFHVWREKYHRNDCLESGKGGKRPKGSKNAYDVNPCYCHNGAKCVVTNENNFETVISSPTVCPINKHTVCTDSAGRKIQPYMSAKRDCSGGRASMCTKDEPCTPCDAASLLVWGGAPRCRICSTDFRGDCKFVEGQGPYCLISPHSKMVEPCKICCTEPGPLFITNQSHVLCY